MFLHWFFIDILLTFKAAERNLWAIDSIPSSSVTIACRSQNKSCWYGKAWKSHWKRYLSRCVNTLKSYLWSITDSNTQFNFQSYHTQLRMNQSLDQIKQQMIKSCQMRKHQPGDEGHQSPTWKYLVRFMCSRASTMFLRSRLDTIAQGIRAVYTASSQSTSPSMGLMSWNEKHI